MNLYSERVRFGTYIRNYFSIINYLRRNLMISNFIRFLSPVSLSPSLLLTQPPPPYRLSFSISHLSLSVFFIYLTPQFLFVSLSSNSQTTLYLSIDLPFTPLCPFPFSFSPPSLSLSLISISWYHYITPHQSVSKLIFGVKKFSTSWLLNCSVRAVRIKCMSLSSHLFYCYLGFI